MAALSAYDWPGNIRELRNVVERLMALSLGPLIELNDLPAAVRASAQNIVREERQPERNRLAAARRSAERQQLEAALIKSNNTRSRAACELGISRVTLYKKLRKYGIA